MTGSALLTDRYELTMLSSFVEDGTVGRRAVFEAFARHLPDGRRFGIVAGIGRLLPLLADFRFTEDEIGWLLAERAVTPATAAYLRGFRFTGSVDGYREGDLYVPYSPVLTVEGTLGECIVLETLVLSVLNHDTAIASTAARMVVAAQGRPLIEMGSRRTHEQAAVAAARAAYLAGFASTSNLAAGRAFDIPTVGTAAHAFTLAHPSEAAAFASQIAAHGTGTTLLVDTYDVEQGIRTAVAEARAAGATGPGAIRIDSGDLDVEARRARLLLDELGATDTRITVTSDLDEHVIAALATAPIDGFGVGTRVVTGSGHPTAGMVYKLVAIAGGDEPGAPLRPVAKTAPGKPSLGGRKTAWRSHDGAGHVDDEVLTTSAGGATPPTDDHRPVQVRYVRSGHIDPQHLGLDQARATTAHALSTLPPDARRIEPGPAFVTARPAPSSL